MITTPDLDPTLVNLVLAALIEQDTPLDQVASTVGLELDDFLELLETPEMRAKIQRLQRALASLIEQVREEMAEREQINRDREKALQDGKKEAVEHADQRLADLDLRFRKLTEAARCARALLNQARRLRQQAAQPSIPHDQTPHQIRPSPPIVVQSA